MNSKSKNSYSLANVDSYKVALITAAVVVFGLGIFLATRVFSLAYSPTDSMPWSVFLEHKENLSSVKDGEIVGFIMPRGTLRFQKWYLSDGHWYPLGSTFVKFVGCIQGQKLNTVGRATYCDGKLLTTVPRFADRIPVPHNRITEWKSWRDYTIPAGYFFSQGPDKFSLDSRYFGLISVKRVTSRDYPLF